MTGNRTATGILSNEPISPRVAVVLLIAIAVALFAMRLTAPPNLLDQDQERPAAYVLDAVKNGNWLCQRDWTGDVTSKPPMWTWLASLVTLANGRVSIASLYLPGAAAGLGSALLVYGFGRRCFGPRAALIGAVACMLTTAAAKQFGLARTDGVFAFTVTLAAFLAYRSWQHGCGWVWFWLAAAAATLTKGPLGLVLAAGGLLAVVWEKRTGTPQPLRGVQWPGVALFFVIAGGWFWLAYLELGDALIAKMLGKELVGHVVNAKKGAFPGTMIYKQPLYYLGRAAPWSLLAYFGVWQIWRRPSPATEARRAERFLFCWFLAGLLIFSLAPHQRADLLWPLMPAAALIAGRELALLTRGVERRKFRLVFGLAAGLGMAGLAAYYFLGQKNRPIVRQTVATQQLAAAIETSGGREFPITYVDAPMTLQVYLNTLRPGISPARAAELLRGSAPAFVAVSTPEPVLDAMGTASTNVHTLLETPVFVPKRTVKLLSNRARIEELSTFNFCFGRLFVKARGLQLLGATEGEFSFTPLAPQSVVTVVNEGDAPRKIRICFSSGGHKAYQERLLEPGQAWSTGPTGR